MAISLWIHYPFWVTTLNSLWNHQETILKSLCYHYRFLNFTMNSLSLSRIHLESMFHYEFTICFAYFLWIHHLLRDFTMNLLYISGIHFEYTICFAYFLWIHHLTINLLSFSRNHCEFTFFFENPLLMKYLFRDISLNSLFVWVIHYRIAVCFLNSLYIKNHSRGFGLNQLFFPRINSEFIVYVANPIWICPLVSESFTNNDSFA